MINLNPITKRILWVFGGFCSFMVFMTWRISLSSAWMRAVVAGCAFGIMSFSIYKAKR
jgi:hypothetical protein